MVFYSTGNVQDKIHFPLSTDYKLTTLEFKQKKWQFWSWPANLLIITDIAFQYNCFIVNKLGLSWVEFWSLFFSFLQEGLTLCKSFIVPMLYLVNDLYRHLVISTSRIATMVATQPPYPVFDFLFVTSVPFLECLGTLTHILSVTFPACSQTNCVE